MADINTLGNVNLDQLGVSLPKQEQKDKQELGQSDFMELLVAQLENQNPLEPQDNAEFISQIAQFGTLDGIGKLNDNFTGLSSSLTSSQALQASALVGHSVTIPSDSAYLDESGGIYGSIDLPSSVPDLVVSVSDASGALVYRNLSGTHPEGKLPFYWDGLDDNGEAVPFGKYSLSATATIGGKTVQLATNLRHNVDSVTLGKDGDGLLLNLAGYGQIGLDAVDEIN